MEDFLAFTETFSAYLFYDLPWQQGDKAVRENFEHQWALLRKGTLFVLRHHPGQHTAKRLEDARRAFEAYAVSIEKVWPWVCTMLALVAPSQPG